MPCALVLFAVLSADPTPFPLPAVDGKPLAVTADQTRFQVPLRFERLRDFYAKQFSTASEVTRTTSEGQGGRVLTLVSHRTHDGWKKAVIRENAFGTEVELVPVIRLSEQAVTGNAKPLVEFVIGRSADVDRAVDHIGEAHLEAIRK